MEHEFDHEGFHLQLIHIFELRLPRTVDNIMFSSIFNVPVDSDAHSLLKRLEINRSRVASLLSRQQVPSDVEHIITSLEEYLTDIISLLGSLEVQTTPIVTRKALEFSWAGSFTTTPSGCKSTPSAFFKCQFIIYEVCMVLHCLGVLSFIHGMNAISAITAVDPTDRLGLLKSASKSFLASAGYFQNLAVDTLPRWVNRCSLSSQPVDIDVQVCQAFYHLAQAAAQQCAITVAISNSALKYSLLSKLCSAVVREAEDAIKCLGEISQSSVSSLNTTIADHAAFLRELFSSLAYYYYAKELQEANKCGEAVSALTMSESKLKIQSFTGTARMHNPSVAGLPKHVTDKLPNIGRFLTVVAHERGAAIRANDLIFFQAVAPVGLPAAVLLSSPSPYLLPNSGKLVDFLSPTKDPASVLASSFISVDEPKTSFRACPRCTLENSLDAINCAACESKL